MRVLLIPLLFLTACNDGQVSESNQAAVAERAKALEKAADVSVDENIAEMTRERLADASNNEAAAQ